MKFIRTYEVRIQPPTGSGITIKPPFTFTMDVNREASAQSNTGTFTFKNLGPSTRNRLTKDRYNTIDYWKIQVFAGYENGSVYELFRGNIAEAYSFKDGADWNTNIEAYDAGWAIQNGHVSETVAGKTSLQDMVKTVIGSMPELLTGVIGGDVSGAPALERGQVLLGPSVDVLADLVGEDKIVIDMETVNILSADEVIGRGGVQVVDTLLESPRRRETVLEAVTTFSPEIKMKRLVELRTVDERFSGQYAVIGIHHAATFSGAECGDARTTLTLDISGSFREVMT